MAHYIRLQLMPRRRGIAGMALVEMIVAMSLLTLVVVSSTQAFLQANRESAVMRLMTAARGIVQRNIDTALTVGWTSSLEPPILALTSPTGAPYDDDAPPQSTTDNVVQIAVMEDGTTTNVPGSLLRTVINQPNPDGALIRKITFRLDYTYLSHSYSVQMVTERAIDD